MKNNAGSEQQPVMGLTEKTRLFPKMVVINSGYPCNAQCPHCPFTFTNSKIRLEQRAKDTPFMPREVFHKIADEVGKHKAILRISGAGEPLLHKEMLDYIDYAKAAGCELGLISNGSLMTEDKARRILASGIEMVEFSVDAADPVTYDIVRKGLKFDETVANIRGMVKLRNEMGAKTSIIASVVNQQIVADKIDSIVEFWDKIVDVVQVRKFLTWDINSLDSSGDVAPYLDPDSPCPFPYDRFLIDSNGDMRFCVYDIKGRTNWGNVMKESLSSVWTGPKFAFLRDIHEKKEFHKMKICENCVDRQFRSWNYNYFHLRERAAKVQQERASAT